MQKEIHREESLLKNVEDQEWVRGSDCDLPLRLIFIFVLAVSKFYFLHSGLLSL